MSLSTPKDFLYRHPSSSLSCSIAEELIREDPRQPQAFITQNKLLFTEPVSELLRKSGHNSWKMNGNISGEERPFCLISQASRCSVFDVCVFSKGRDAWVSPSSLGYIRKNPNLPVSRCSYTSHLRQPPAGKHLGQLIRVKGLAPGIYVAVPNTRINLPRPQLPLTPSKVNIPPKITSKKPFKVSFKVFHLPEAQTANWDSCGNSRITLWLQQPPTQPAQSVQSWSWRPNPAHQKPPAPVITRHAAQAALTADTDLKNVGFQQIKYFHLCK